MSAQKDRPFRIAVIGSYPVLAQKIIKMGQEMNILMESYYATFDGAGKIARRIEPTVDAIISRGNTTISIRQAVSVPVVNISVSPFDLTLALDELKEHLTGPIAFLNYGRKLYGIRDIEQRYGIEIREYVVKAQEDLTAGMESIHKMGIKTVIGGNVAVKMAAQMGIFGQEISGGQESIYNAIREAVRLIQIRKEDQKKAEWLYTTLNSLSEGILVEDPQGKIIMHNRSAAKLLQTHREIVDGNDLSVFLPDCETQQDDKPGGSCLLEVNGCKVACSTIPVQREGEYIAKVHTLEDVTRIQQLERQVRMELHKRGLTAKYHFEDIATQSARMHETIQEAILYAKSDAAILIEGESGTGKEMLAQGIHNCSFRKNGPFVAINCAALTESLLESELFGYEAGAFSGAKKEGKAGLFEIAHNGTIFLDEIGEIPLSFQAKILRVLQEKEIRRIGSDKVLPVNIRVISATNRNLRERLQHGEFRVDLYYRLNVFHLKVPALRERQGDVELLLRHFLQEKLQLNTLQESKLQEFISRLDKYSWPGNVRELRNIAERIDLYLRNLDNKMISSKIVMQSTNAAELKSGHTVSIDVDISRGLKNAREEAEKQIIDKAYELCGGDQQQILELLDVGRTTLWRKMSDVSIPERHIQNEKHLSDTAAEKKGQ